eukprot:CAMPEP_0182441680 /NCGR_PEP_ID=MMETSP1172-20130603/658_1 /TAXON_ID=708627 /ORGANISM="Timspurckia oligopyrenoides, Strain CCMP3278" /LENGTH=721 /DNA_ID=CAMNT_0024636125 /DNA_START=214 /DNA_END=2379 /DNA_ORIENTATION=+
MTHVRKDSQPPSLALKGRVLSSNVNKVGAAQLIRHAIGVEKLDEEDVDSISDLASVLILPDSLSSPPSKPKWGDEAELESFYFDENGLPIVSRILERITRQGFYTKTQWGVNTSENRISDNGDDADRQSVNSGDDKEESLKVTDSDDSLKSFKVDSGKNLSGSLRSVPMVAQALLPVGVLEKLIEDVSTILMDEPNIVDVSSPVTIFGDLHGQFIDLLNAVYHSRDLNLDGSLKSECNWVFLGDYVDRGCHAVEIISYLFAMKIRYPKNVFLLRGNHESRAMTFKSYVEGICFSQECTVKYSRNLYHKVMRCFDKMPLAAIVTVAASDIVPEPVRMFCSHAGLSPGAKTLAQIMKIDRFREIPPAGVFCDLLWSDPIAETGVKLMSEKEYADFMRVKYMRNEMRGCSWLIGFELVREFLEKNNLVGVIRGHQVAKSGVSFHFNKTRDGTSLRYPMITTVFSAPNYCGQYTNRGAILKINDRADYLVYRYSRPNDDSRGGLIGPASPGIFIDDDFEQEGSFQRASSWDRDSNAETHPGWMILRSTVKQLVQILRTRSAELANLDRTQSNRIGEEMEKIDSDFSPSESFDRSENAESEEATSSNPLPTPVTPPTVDPVIQKRHSQLVRIASVEAVQELESIIKPDDREQLRYIFGSLDQDNDGFLDVEETEDFVNTLRTIADEDNEYGLMQLVASFESSRKSIFSFEDFILWAEKGCESVSSL